MTLRDRGALNAVLIGMAEIVAQKVEYPAPGL